MTLPKIVSLFSGAGGLDFNFNQARRAMANADALVLAAEGKAGEDGELVV